MNGASNVDGRVVDRNDTPATPLGETFHSDNYAPDRGRRGQGHLNFFRCPRGAQSTALIHEMARGGGLMGHQGMALRRWYAEDLRLRAPVRRNMAIVEAFAA